MISVAEALDGVLSLVKPLGTETVPLSQAAGRVLAAPACATRDQPPFASSAMDGYAVRDADLQPGAALCVIGESAAGARSDAIVNAGEAVRIFTGAPVPGGADRILIQEDCTRQGDTITVGQNLDPSTYIRPAGGDFRTGDTLDAPRPIGAAEVSLLASMNVARVTVRKRPEVALIATGDELVMPGEVPGPDQIVSSNNLGLAALVIANGGIARGLPIAADTEAALLQTFDFARGADLIITLGGASVGDRDLVRKVAQDAGLNQSFYKVAMRPGKPLMAGKLHGAAMIGLPGNPVSALVCGHVFVLPALRKMLGLPPQTPLQEAPLSCDIVPNGPRTHYMRARLENGTVTPLERQDSSLLSVMAQANCLVVRQPYEPNREVGEPMHYLAL
ncbi:MAG: gephyrin-like molybdotransferase Glp [Pseudomonadota bacterium]